MGSEVRSLRRINNRATLTADKRSRMLQEFQLRKATVTLSIDGIEPSQEDETK